MQKDADVNASTLKALHHWKPVWPHPVGNLCVRAPPPSLTSTPVLTPATTPSSLDNVLDTSVPSSTLGRWGKSEGGEGGAKHTFLACTVLRGRGAEMLRCRGAEILRC